MEREIKDFWISVEVSLPKSKKDVYVWDIENGVKEDYFIRGEVRGWANSKSSKITHWIEKNKLHKLIEPTEYIGDPIKCTGAFEGQ